MKELLLLVILAFSVGCGVEGDPEFHNSSQAAADLESSDATVARAPSTSEDATKESRASAPAGEKDAIAEPAVESQASGAENTASENEADKEGTSDQASEVQKSEANELNASSQEPEQTTAEPVSEPQEPEQQELAEPAMEPQESEGLGLADNSESESEEQVAEEESQPAEEEQPASAPESEEQVAEEESQPAEEEQPASEPAVPEIVDTETISDLCQDLENIVVTESLVYPARSGCGFGQGDNLSKLNEYLRAYETQTQLINIPSDSLLCDFRLESSSANWRYDDFVMLTLNQKVLISSNMNIVNNLTSTNNIFTWDWSQAQNTNLSSMFNAGAYCLEGTCEIPNHDQAGSVEINLDPDTMLELASQISNNQSIQFDLLSFGDNDNGDCEHTGLDLTVTYKYVLQQ